MNKTDKEHTRILFAGFALAGAIMSKDSWTPKAIWGIADDMIEEMEKKPIGFLYCPHVRADRMYGPIPSAQAPMGLLPQVPAHRSLSQT